MSAIDVSSTALPQSASLAPPASTAKSAFWQKYLSERRPEVRQLKEALESGDLSAAQQAYNNLLALGKQVLHKDNPFLRRDRALDFNAIGGALQSGDLDGARQAFAALHDTYRHKQPPVATSSTPATAAVVTLSSSSNAGPELGLSLGKANEGTVVSENGVNVVA
jgi:hypothetical protein